MFKTKDLETLPSYFPYGIYTIPEISMVGLTEEEAEKSDLAYCTGIARYSDMARGEIMGAKSGFFKNCLQPLRSTYPRRTYHRQHRLRTYSLRRTSS